MLHFVIIIFTLIQECMIILHHINQDLEFIYDNTDSIVTF